MDNWYTPRHRSIQTSFRLALAALLIAGVYACADTFHVSGASPAATAATVAHADQMFEAFVNRFSTNLFGPKYNAGRVKLAQAALTPSRIFNDSASWDARPSPAIRHMYVSGSIGADGRYSLEDTPALTRATRGGDSRHIIALEQLTPNNNTFRWDTRVDLAIGTITTDEIAGAASALLRSSETRTERDVRDDYRAAFPRATSAFGKGFSLDSATIAPGALGTTSVTLKFGFHPELMKPAYPQLAGYLDKYLGPAKYHFAVGDRAGAAMFDVVGRDRSVTLRYRVQQGKLVSLLGPPRPWPDTLQLTADVSLKVKIFTVGFHQLVTDFVFSNNAVGAGHERAWAVVAQREPQWDLPFLTERLIKSPLRRPFEGQGSMFRVSVRDSAGTQSLFTRHTRLEVQESAIMRFIGSLASHAVSDLDDRVEIDEHRFFHDGFVALLADLRGMSPRPPKEL